MERYYSKASPKVDVPSSSVNEHPQILPKEVSIGVDSPPQASTKGMNIEIDLENLPSDPGLRLDIMSYPPNLIELNASVVCLRYLIMQGLAFRGKDESERSLNQGNFIELLKVVASCNEDISKVVLKNAPDNLKLTSPDIQIDECRDVSVKEQMGVVIRYVDKNGCVIERFLGLVHVSDTASTSLEMGIDSLFSTHGLSVSSLRGQGYDGASNMRGEFNGLKSLILKRTPSAYYVHYFAHQLQLTIVAVAKNIQVLGHFLILSHDYAMLLVVLVSAEICFERIKEKKSLKVLQMVKLIREED
ncbi:uncharacterized protein LOC131008229 [Salvia miltiorrhiza]|uniref:uncharacterized protein LOC131008229 n=1 Tax=Salvia miltiorrhiza TaxID=226208 RepID=UPI0025AC9187|nr:uncharacterized protein LOC131008229 [Salvia miltiorrhiza]